VLSDHALHLLTRVLLRLCSPPRAHAIVARIGGVLPVRDRVCDIERAATTLKGRGSCLSRALTLAARIPDADVVIGVQPRPGMRLLAHAWIERSGAAMDPSDVVGAEIARLNGLARRLHRRVGARPTPSERSFER
jgi:hypothetical protein